MIRRVLGSWVAVLLCSGVAEAHSPATDQAELWCDAGFWATESECSIHADISKQVDMCYHYIEKLDTMNESYWLTLEEN